MHLESQETRRESLKNVDSTVMTAFGLIDNFAVVWLVAWPLDESGAGVDLVLIETSLLFLCKFLLITEHENRIINIRKDIVKIFFDNGHIGNIDLQEAFFRPKPTANTRILHADQNTQKHSYRQTNCFW